MGEDPAKKVVKWDGTEWLDVGDEMLSSRKVEHLIHRSTEPDTLDFKRELPDTLNKAKLAELGYIEGEPTVEEFVKKTMESVRRQ